MQSYQFPDPNLADDDGLVAAGGDLSVACLVSAYRKGIFPWFNEGDPYLWWSPNPRTVIFPSKIHVSKSLKKRLKKNDFEVSFNRCFDKVIDACSKPRNNFSGIETNLSLNTGNHSWITNDMKSAYSLMHQQGYAMSVETWYDGNLAGGLYGIFMGKVFFGESMFSTQADASKIALVYLCQKYFEQIEMIDCQMKTDHIMRMGAELILRKDFLSYLKRWV